MGRRTIVIEDTTYHWQTNGYEITVIPPKGKGKPRKFDGHRELNRDHEYYYDEGAAITPSLIAELIYRDILGKPMPPRKQGTLPRRHAEPKVPSWTTAPDMPRSYLVQALPAGGGEAIPLEVHETPATAMAAVERLGTFDVARVLKEAWRDPARKVEYLDHSLLRSDVGDAVRKLIAWVRQMKPDASGSIPELRFASVELPFKMPR